MPTTFLCQKARMGSTDYYIGTMKAGALVRSVGYVADLPDWNELTIDERIQREIDETRIKQEIVPYLQQDLDHFFGALIIDVYKGWENLIFEPLTSVAKVTNKIYEMELRNIGYLHLPGADHLVALDGQHRLKALHFAIFGDGDKIKSNPDLTDDDITVMFVMHTDNKKIRNIFNKVNRYARSTSRGDNIITSEDDAIAILARRLISDGTLLSQDLVNWKSNTLSQRSHQFTTISAIYEILQILLDEHSELKSKLKMRPSEEALEGYYNEVFEVWDAVLNGVNLFEDLEPESIIIKRAKYLSFKPAGLISLFIGLRLAIKNGAILGDAVERINGIDWDKKSDMWKNIIMKPDGNIIAKAENREITSRLIAYMIAKEKFSPEFEAKLARDYVAKKEGKEKAENDEINKRRLEKDLLVGCPNL